MPSMPCNEPAHKRRVNTDMDAAAEKRRAETAKRNARKWKEEANIRNLIAEIWSLFPKAGLERCRLDCLRVTTADYGSPDTVRFPLKATPSLASRAWVFGTKMATLRHTMATKCAASRESTISSY